MSSEADPRPADLTAQGRMHEAVIGEEGRCGVPTCWCSPVASPEAPTCVTCGHPDAKHMPRNDHIQQWCNVEGCKCVDYTAPPAGPETGWMLPETDEAISVAANHVNENPGTAIARALHCLVLELVKQGLDRASLGSALSAATERATDLQRERDDLDADVKAADALLEQHGISGYETTAEGIARLLDSRAAALKLAGEAVDWADALAEHNNDSTYDAKIASARSRLAALEGGDK